MDGQSQPQPQDAESAAEAWPLTVYATAPPARGRTPDEFGHRLATTARWAEAAGIRGMLVFTDNGSVDPWAAAQFMVERTTRLVPLVAIQPLYAHPYTTARMVSAIACMYGRRVDLNLVTGSYVPDLRALGNSLDHDERYDRLRSYGQILAALLFGTDPVTHHGPHYELIDAVIYPSLPAGLAPGVFVAGQSPASAAVARALGAMSLTTPDAPDQYEPEIAGLRNTAIRIGVIARPTTREAWEVARRRYPLEPMKERFHESAVGGYAAEWLRNLWHRSSDASERADVYWLYPYRVTREYCPYLVGSYTEVAAALSRYMNLGVTTIVLSVPFEPDDLYHAGEAIRIADQAPARLPAAATRSDRPGATSHLKT